MKKSICDTTGEIAEMTHKILENPGRAKTRPGEDEAHSFLSVSLTVPENALFREKPPD